MEKLDRKDKTIFVVDDNSDNLGIVAGFLKSAGYEVSVASSGNMAVKRAERIKPVVILLDINMPGMDGFEVCRKLKRNTKTLNIPVIFLTASDDIKSIKKGFQVGGVDYLVKPVQKGELLARVLTQMENYIYKNKLEQEVRNRTRDLEESNKLLKEEIARRVETEKKLQTILYSIGDGVITTDMEASIVRMNPVAEELTGWTIDRAEGKELSEVFKIVNVKTREISETSVEKVMKSGKIVSLAEHMILLSKQGSEYMIADSAAPIRDDKGEFTGVVLVFRDITEEYRVQESLRQSEERLDLAMFGANDGLWDWYLDIDRIVFDSRYYTMAGYTPDEFPGAFEEWEKRIHPEEIREAKMAIEQYLAGERESYKIEFRFLRKDGDYMWIRAKGKIVTRDEKGAPLRFVGTHSDITQSKQAEEALQESERTLREAQKFAHLGSWFWDVKSGHVEWSDEVYNIFRLSREEFTPQIDSILGLSPWPGDQDRATELIQRAIESHKQGSYEQRFLHPDNTIGHYFSTFQGFYDAEGNLATMKGTVQDITERKKNEEALKKAQDYIINIIDSMPSILIGVDINAQITQWNKAAQKATGVSSKDAMGQSLGRVVPRLDSEMKLVNRALINSVEQTDLKKTYNKDGETHYENITVYPLISNGVKGAVIRIDDVTEKERIEEMMIQSEKMLSVGGLAAGMAHEINNPLAAMIQTANVMSKRLTDIEIPANRHAAEKTGITMDGIKSFMEKRDIPRMLAAINESGCRIADIVKNMLSFARKSEDALSFYDPVDLFDKTLELAATEYDFNKEYDFNTIKILKEYEDHLPMLPCEGVKIQQVLLNILRNGAQAMQEGLKKNRRITPKFIIRLLWEKKTNMLRIEVEDSGPGIDEVTKKRIFEPFFTTKPIGIGTGLGLSVSYFIITKNHRGTMDVISKLEEGTTFIIRLPLEGE
jgi:PAS domain S-box-containing protein